MSTLAVECPCGARGEGRRGSVADNAPRGWSPFASNDRGFQFLCPACSGLVADHASALVQVLGTPHVTLVALPGARATPPPPPPVLARVESLLRHPSGPGWTAVGLADLARLVELAGQRYRRAP